jgi:hypothetical protein
MSREARCYLVFMRVRKIVRPSVRMNSVPTRRFSWNLIFEYFFESLSRKFKVSMKDDKNNG